ncbi:MAG: hypothetical protein LBL82_08940 [Oscillospiraceae bacterium]|jgi:hypothetical protein|nr:hypothetical protein [Oscillospiraceae bacterium]
MKQIPELSEHILNSFVNQLESGFDWEIEESVENKIKCGVLLMESALGIGGDNSYHNDIIDDYAEAEWQEYGKKHFWYRDNVKEIIKSVGAIVILQTSTFFIASLFGAFDGLFDLAPYISFILPIIPITSLIMYTSRIKNRKQVIVADAKNAAKRFNDDELIKHCPSFLCYSFRFLPYLTNIALKMGVDPIEAKIGLGRVSGGGSTFIGSGVGPDIVFTGISKIRAASENAKINDRIEDLEFYSFYNNIANYFNQNISAKTSLKA